LFRSLDQNAVTLSQSEPSLFVLRVKAMAPAGLGDFFLAKWEQLATTGALKDQGKQRPAKTQPAPRQQLAFSPQPA
jgi:hypothetical protein